MSLNIMLVPSTIDLLLLLTISNNSWTLWRKRLNCLLFFKSSRKLGRFSKIFVRKEMIDRSIRKRGKRSNDCDDGSSGMEKSRGFGSLEGLVGGRTSAMQNVPDQLWHGRGPNGYLPAGHILSTIWSLTLLRTNTPGPRPAMFVSSIFIPAPITKP